MGHYHHSQPVKVMPPPTPQPLSGCGVNNVPCVIQAPTTPQPSVQAPVSAPSGGGGQIYCSSPTAPGWRVDLPHGGCTAGVIHLNQLPSTGAPEGAYALLTGIILFCGIMAWLLAPEVEKLLKRFINI